MADIIPTKRIESKIVVIRGQSVILDRDLAELYGVETRVLTQAVRRNIKRFPEDFMFQLNYKEFTDLKSQFVTSSWGGTRKMPFAFTENGVAMLSSVLKSEKAIEINIQIMRIFTKLRGLLREYEELKEFVISVAKKQQEDVTFIFMELDRLNQLFESRFNKKRIGFKKEE